MSEIRPAATAVIVRDGEKGLEVLLVRRHQQSKVGSGAWVFPGGVVEDEDFASETDDPLAAARCAAVRETREEASLHIVESKLQFISHWTTPPGARKRFSTWFFLSEADCHEVVVDGEEIDEHWWCSPSEALARHRSEELVLMPPTVVTLTELCTCNSVAAARSFFAGRPVPFIEPRMVMEDDKICMLYRGDAGYETGDMTATGGRNRCWLEGKIWRYEYAE